MFAAFNDRISSDQIYDVTHTVNQGEKIKSKKYLSKHRNERGNKDWTLTSHKMSREKVFSFRLNKEEYKIFANCLQLEIFWTKHNKYTTNRNAKIDHYNLITKF